MNNVPEQKHASRVSRLAIASCCLAILPWILYGLFRPVSVTVEQLLTLVPWPLSVIIGISALVLIKYRRPGLRGKTLAIAGIAISMASFVFAFSFLSVRNLNKLIYKPMEQVRACQGNMSRLYTSLKDYAVNHDGLLPAGSNWCDELLQENEGLAATFVCRNSDGKPGQSSYALNKNAAGQKLLELPSDTVLLFETTAGWNQVGGPEIVTTDNHSLISGEHCNVVFARGGTQNFSDDKIHELRWKP